MTTTGLRGLGWRLLGAGVCVPVIGWAMAGCTADPPTVTPEPGTAFLTPDASAQAMKIEIRNTELSVGLERVAFVLSDEGGTMIGPEATVTTEFYRLSPSGDNPVLASSGPAQYFGSGLPGGGSWVVYAPFDSSGEWGFGILANRPDGSHGRSRFNVQVAARPAAPRVGQVPPFGDTPKAGADLAAVTSDTDPNSALYAQSITEAAASGRPTVVHFGSPAHCVTGEACQAALDQIKGAWALYQDRVNFVHVETHSLDDPATLSAAATAWGLPSEPWTFILDAHGRITVRAEGAVDQVELGLLIDRELAKPGG